MANPLDKLLCTEDRRRIWRALRTGVEVYITPEQRAVDRMTGEDLGCQIAAQAIWFEGYAQRRPGTKWVLEWNKQCRATLDGREHREMPDG